MPTTGFGRRRAAALDPCTTGGSRALGDDSEERKDHRKATGEEGRGDAHRHEGSEGGRSCRHRGEMRQFARWRRGVEGELLIGDSKSKAAGVEDKKGRCGDLCAGKEEWREVSMRELRVVSWCQFISREHGAATKGSECGIDGGTSSRRRRRWRRCTVVVLATLLGHCSRTSSVASSVAVLIGEGGGVLATLLGHCSRTSSVASSIAVLIGEGGGNTSARATVTAIDARGTAIGAAVMP